MFIYYIINGIIYSITNEGSRTMSRDRQEIDRVRSGIAGVIFNDGLPTGLTTNSLKDICFNYENYLEAEKRYVTQTDQNAALEAIRASINLINKQNKNSGSAYNIIYPKDDSLEAIKDIAETISIIYAIPYKATSDIDYVGYAYGMITGKMQSQNLYDLYKPDDFINQCSIGILDDGDQKAADAIMKKMANCAGTVDYLKGIENGTIYESPQPAKNLIQSRFNSIAKEVSKLTGIDIKTKYHMEESLYNASCVNACLTFCNRHNIEEYRADGIFKDNRAADMVFVSCKI